MLRNNLDYIKEQLAREEKFVRKEIEQIKLEQQNLKETLEKINQKVDKLLEQRNIVISEEQKLNNLLEQFENFNLGEKPRKSIQGSIDFIINLLLLNQKI